MKWADQHRVTQYQLLTRNSESSDKICSRLVLDSSVCEVEEGRRVIRMAAAHSPFERMRRKGREKDRKRWVFLMGMRTRGVEEWRAAERVEKLTHPSTHTTLAPSTPSTNYSLISYLLIKNSSPHTTLTVVSTRTSAPKRPSSDSELRSRSSSTRRFPAPSPPPQSTSTCWVSHKKSAFRNENY
jgi:hypothetical protein